MDTGTLTNILTTFTGVFGAGFGRLLPDAQHLLSILAALEIFFAAIWWAFDDGQRVETQLIKKILHIGFFIWVVSNYRWLVELVLNGFIATGEKASGHSSDALLMDPSLIIDRGFAATDPIFKYIQNFHMLEVGAVPSMILVGLSGLLVLLAYFALAITVFLTYLEFYMVAVLGLILVPFAVFKHTAFLSEKVFGAVISYGIRLMVLAFILGIIDPILARNTLPADPSLPQILTALVTTLTIAVLSWHAPAVASGLMAGSPSLSAGTMLGTAAAVGAGITGTALGIGSATSAGVQTARAGVSATRAAAGAISHGWQKLAGGGTQGGSGAAMGNIGAAAAIYRGGRESACGKSRNGRGENRGGGIGRSSGIPGWAQQLMMAHQSIPHEAHPGPGINPTLRTD